jgi:hypothetical protein
MNGDTIAIIVKTGTAGAKTTAIVLYPEEAGDIRVDVTMLSGDASAADNAESFFDGTGYAGTNNVIPTVTTTTTATNVTTVNGLAAGVITAAAIATGAIDADAIAADAITAAKLAADVTTELQTGLATAVNLATVDTVVDAILADTGTDGVVVNASSLATDAANEIADAVLSRGVSNVQDTADTTSLAALILAAFESAISGTTWTIRKTGGTTFVTKTVTVDAAADPITGIT